MPSEVTAISSSQRTINKKLDRLLKEVRAGHREGSCVSVQTVDSINTTETWKDLRRELESVGITTSAINENQDYIISWFQNAISKGLLQEEHPCTELSTNQAISWSPNLSPQIAYDSAESAQRKQSEGAVSFTTTLSPTESTSSYASSTGRRTSRLSSVVFKLFRSDLALLEAASDGDAKRVDELISKGANVNVKDRWGWRPMSMAAYGGYVDIAHLLICAGADLDYKDVDGDGPLELATNRGKCRLTLL
jgi:hypothetical protein